MVDNRSGSSGVGLERSCAEPSADWIRSTEAIGGVELIEAWFQGRAYRKHRHDTYAIGLTDSGVQAFDYRGSTHVSMPGQVVVLHPDEAHDGRAGSDAGFGYRLLYVEPALIFDAVRSLRGRASALPFVRHPVVTSTTLSAAIRAAFRGQSEPLAIDDLVLQLAAGLLDAGPCRRPAPVPRRRRHEPIPLFAHAASRLRSRATLPAAAVGRGRPGGGFRRSGAFHPHVHRHLWVHASAVRRAAYARDGMSAPFLHALPDALLTPHEAAIAGALVVIGEPAARHEERGARLAYHAVSYVASRTVGRTVYFDALMNGRGLGTFMPQTVSVVPKKDAQSVTPEGTRVAPMIDGVVIHRIPPQEDERGEIVEIWNLDWPGLDDPVVHVYKVTTRPGKTRAWQMHQNQDDRLFVSRGRLRFGLYDDRDGSPTRGMLNVFTLSDHQRAMVRIPCGVWHGVQNVGEGDGVFVNLPTRRYMYEDPDKYRLPLQNDLIPFDFSDDRGR